MDGTTVVIHYENGDTEVWGYEPNEKIAIEIAKDIELGLKAIDYVSFELMKKLTELAEQLEALDIPKNYSYEYINEGYCKIFKWFNELREKKPIPLDT